jgi:hypothetical protein
MPLFDTAKVTLDNDEWVEIKELSVGELREADQVGTEIAASMMKLLPEKVVEAELNKQREQTLDRIIRYEGYDPETLIKYGILSWSYKEECTKENRALLSAKRGEIVGRAIFELSVIPTGEVVRSSLKPNGAESQEDSPELISSTASEER